MTYLLTSAITYPAHEGTNAPFCAILVEENAISSSGRRIVTVGTQLAFNTCLNACLNNREITQRSLPLLS